jgi:carbonic anhydrase
VRESAKATSVQITTTNAIVQDQIATGKVKVVAARYDLDTGRVEFLA